MENARIALIEDDPRFRELIHEILQNSSHVILAEATTPEESLRLAQQIKTGLTAADLILLDGNLSGQTPRDGHDARAFIDALGYHRRQVHVVGISLDSMVSYGVMADADIGKLGLVHHLTDVIDGLQDFRSAT